MSDSIIPRVKEDHQNLSTEYALPNPELPENVVQKIHPWFHQFIHADIPTIKNALENRWATLSYKPLIDLKNLLVSWIPLSLVVTRQHSYLRLFMPGGDPDYIGYSTYIREQFDDNDFETTLKTYGQDRQSCLRGEFSAKH